MLSEAARDFIASTPPDAAPADIGAIGERRRSNRERYREGSLRAIAENAVTLREITLGGVACTEVTPQDGRTELTIFHCFGGGFVTGSPFEEARILAPLSRLAMARVVCPSYRLAPEHPFPAGLDDLGHAYEALLGEAAGAGVALVGESAGGNLALSLLNRLDRGSLPHAVALMSPWCDLANTGESIAFNAGRDPTLGRAYLDVAARAYAGGRDLADAAISPLHAGLAEGGFPPVMITTGTRDLLMSDSIRLAHRLHRGGNPALLRVWEGLWHVFEFYNDIPESRMSLAEIAAFLRQGAALAPLAKAGGR